ncbi:hypothetical protein V2J09_008425 [Rumex salicifolius]
MTDLFQVVADMVGVTFEHVCDWSKGGGIPILTLLDRCKELCRARERNEMDVASMYLLMLLGSTVFTDKTTQKVKLKYASLVLNLDHVTDYAWGAAILELTYCHLGQASRARGAGIVGCLLLLKSWIWAYFHGPRGHSQPSMTCMRDA